MRYIPSLAGLAALSLAALGSATQATYAQNQTDLYSNDQNNQQQYDYDSNDNNSQFDERSQSSDYDYNNRNQSRDSQYNSRDQALDNNQPDNRNQWREDSDNRSYQGRNSQPAGLGVLLESTRGTIQVAEVTPNSPADNAGIRAGDQILAVNGRDVNSTQQLAQLIRQERPGSQVRIRIRRDGQQRTLTAELESRREALNMSQQQWQGRQEQRYYRNAPPWESDDLMRHVDALERQVDRLQREVSDLRTMLQDNPSGRRFSLSQRNQNENRGFRDGRQTRSSSGQRSDNQSRNSNNQNDQGSRN